MLRNYLKIGLRNLLKNKLFSIINISGMAISIASFLIIMLFIYDELRFDKHVEDVTTKYRVFNERFESDGRIQKVAMVPPVIGPALVSEYPDFEYTFRLMNIRSSVLFENGDIKLTERRGGYADSTVFDMFSLKLVEGDKKTALSGANTVAISKTLARKYFGDKPALGASMTINDQPSTVGGVFEDFSSHSHIQLDYFLPMAALVSAIPERMQSWHWSQFHTYIKVRPGADEADLAEKLRSFAERTAWPKTKPSNGSYYVPHLMRMDKIHLYASDHAWDIAVLGSAQTVYILTATAIFILIIAILNFVNLSTARAVNRVKEVGVRKVVGAFRMQLIYQFITESMIIAFIALMIAGLVTELVIPGLNSFTEKNIPTGIFLNPLLLGGVILAAVFIGVAAGAYPAFYISSYKPAQILSNKQSGRSGKTLLRKGLVVVQFMLSFFLIIAALVVSRQHTYMRTKDMGFNKDNVIVLPLRGEMQTRLDATKNSFLNHANVISGTLGYGLPGEAYAGDGVIDVATKKEWGISMLTVDHDYIKTMGIHVIAGRDFSKEFATDDSTAFIISESAAKMFGYTDPKDALNHELAWPRWDNPDKKKEGRVVGIVKDFHLNSLKENMTPIMLHIYPFGYSTLTLRVKGENLPETLAFLESTWKKYNPEWPFEYRFLDDNFDKLYKSEEKLAKMFTFFTAFTIFVACLGLFGLVVYSTSQKYKEISIRKVLGAEEGGLVLHLAKSYLVLIAIAFVIAIPLSYYFAEQWLQKFAFRIEVTPMLFVQAAFFILVLSLLTVGIQSLKAARTNPVNALKEQ